MVSFFLHANSRPASVSHFISRHAGCRLRILLRDFVERCAAAPEEINSSALSPPTSELARDKNVAPRLSLPLSFSIEL